MYQTEPEYVVKLLYVVNSFSSNNSNVQFQDEIYVCSLKYT